MSKERSPRFPAESLSDALVRTEALYTAAGRSPVTSDVAAREIGYGGLSGASRTAMAAISYYGLLQREGDKHRISELGLRLIRPLSDSDKLDSARTAALKPPVFAEIEKDHSDCTEQVLASVLLHSGFTDDGARRAAKVYKENVAFIKSLEQGVPTNERPTNAPPKDPPLDLNFKLPNDQTGGGPAPQIRGKMLAQYQIPLGANHAQLTFTGEKLLPEDFDALGEYVELFKKQYMRAQAGVVAAKAAFAAPILEESSPPPDVAGDYYAYHGTPLKPGKGKDDDLDTKKRG